MYAGDALTASYIGSVKNNIALSAQGVKNLFSPDHVIQTTKAWSFHGLIVSKFLGLFSSFSYLSFSFFRKDRQLLKEISPQNMKKMAIEHKDFPRINMLHALTDELKTSGLSFVILIFFYERILGIYNMTYKILRAPLSIIGNSFSHVFFQKAAEQYANKEKISPFVQKTTRKLFIIGLPIFLIIFLFAPPIFTFVLGEKWSDAGIYAQYLTPWLFVNFVISPISQVAIILKKQFAFWMINLFSNVLIFLSILWAGAVVGDIKTGFIIISVTQVIFYIWVYLWLTKIIKHAEESY
jgi:O-antigen/teichoic acid export membrane protein